MNKKDIAEIKRRLKIEKTTITRVAGCYVNEEKEKLMTFSKNFMNLEEDETHKYLELAAKPLSGTPGNNLLELEFKDGMQESLLALRDSKLEDEAVLDAFYDRVIENYQTTEHFLILLFYDNYDIPMKTLDNLLLDDSEEVYEYIIVSICPVKLTQAGLGYDPVQKQIAPRHRDRVVGPAECGFTFPCFSDRSADIHHLLAYTKNPKEPPFDFWEAGLGVESKFTTTQKRLGFLGLVAKAVGEENEETPEFLLDVQQNIHDYVVSKEDSSEKDEPIRLSEQDIQELLEDSGLSEDRSASVASEYNRLFSTEETEGTELYEAKALKDNELRHEKKLLQEKVASLSDELLSLGLVDEYGEIIDIVVRTRPERKDSVETTFVDGRRCILIPLKEDDTATLNGEEL